MIVWAVTTPWELANGRKTLVICQGKDREMAKRQAQPELKGNPDEYIVQPLSEPKDSIVLKISILGEVS